ncbi:hypothetical protein AVEN_139948-1 [Araneus ventricosus]|uniref:Uncharacterized protein n=1 Tax=Araneus ventricosus TaxID=182803 RepID=A0A4Y2SN82_ARAVE|nr:hypothetical protein AVEN_139948-1 [Araneus ventricosus]
MAKTTPKLSPPLQTSIPHQHLAPCKIYHARTPYMADFLWIRVSNLEPSGPEAETLPLGHLCLYWLGTTKRRDDNYCFRWELRWRRFSSQKHAIEVSTQIAKKVEERLPFHFP